MAADENRKKGSQTWLLTLPGEAAKQGFLRKQVKRVKLLGPSLVKDMVSEENF